LPQLSELTIGRGAFSAQARRRENAGLPIEIVPVDSDLVLVRQAAEFKALHKMSCADAFAAALAKTRKAELITGDREFKPLERDIKVHWLDS
jgi:predicted nucleic acid-binding protein